MFKSETVNSIVSLIGIWIIVIFVLFNDNTIGNSLIFWSIVGVFTVYDLYRIVISRGKNSKD